MCVWWLFVFENSFCVLIEKVKTPVTSSGNWKSYGMYGKIRFDFSFYICVRFDLYVDEKYKVCDDDVIFINFSL